MTITKNLTSWYSNSKRDLPWRKTKDPYRVWLSEIILQQTQIKQGLPYYERFILRFPNVYDLANASEEEVLKLWQGLGYYSRARNLHATAKYVAYELNGQFPETYGGLLKLKGIGDYTASAIASICFGEPSAVLDGNVYRFLSRYFGIDTPINTSQGFKVFKALAQDILDERDPEKHNQAIMEFGALHCTPTNPSCDTCPFQNTCVAFAEGKTSELPVKLKGKKPEKKYFNFLVFLSDNETILEKRKGKGIWKNLYQFPLVETSKSLKVQEVQVLVDQSELLSNTVSEIYLYNEDDIVHKLSHRHLYTKFWIVLTDRLPVEGVNWDLVKKYAVPILIGNFLEVFNFQEVLKE
ncbi:A/G-specific adenine glycosylase [Mangrovimonas sp. CR14]|uniref:A/G-specific adenine glycosylase n=1 Tax=Mangrovimonas sp. CR14 TaxID=2706120 RepID=UPI0014200F0A|nr:A/G-specific adenine glycosylase [Mangrovimonas sp. CR14]NIK91692.1 A/G-specific adenine glycosylase [Mangrovimonas sp. CR14]